MFRQEREQIVPSKSESEYGRRSKDISSTTEAVLKLNVLIGVLLL